MIDRYVPVVGASGGLSSLWHVSPHNQPRSRERTSLLPNEKGWDPCTAKPGFSTV